MKLVITSVVAVIFVALGSLAGVILKPAAPAAAAVTTEAGEGDYAGAKKDDHGGDKKAKKGDKYDKPSSSGDSA